MKSISWSKFLTWTAFLVFATNCEYIGDRFKAPNNSSFADKLRDYIVSAYFAETNHALFKFSTEVQPVPVNSLGNLYFQDPFFQRDNAKPKLVFIHGWDFAERMTDLPTDNNKKITNLLGTWNQGLAYSTSESPTGFGGETVYDKFEIYVFTYRTADYIETNGRRFIDTLNQYFSASDKVIVVAHSMGGLVSRAAILHPNNTNDVIDHIVSLGTPYYGSPFSSPQYQGDMTAIGSVVAFMTDTPGGQGLAYTNGISASVNDMAIPIVDGTNQAYNFFLESLIENTSKNAQTTAYGGNMGPTDCLNGNHDLTYSGGCTILNNESPQFPNSDGIVPLTSALMNGHLTNTYSISDLDHSQMSFRDPSGNNTLAVTAHFNDVFDRIFNTILPTIP